MRQTSTVSGSAGASSVCSAATSAGSPVVTPLLCSALSEFVLFSVFSDAATPASLALLNTASAEACASSGATGASPSATSVLLSAGAADSGTGSTVSDADGAGSSTISDAGASASRGSSCDSSAPGSSPMPSGRNESSVATNASVGSVGAAPASAFAVSPELAASLVFAATGCIGAAGTSGTVIAGPGRRSIT